MNIERISNLLIKFGIILLAGVVFILLILTIISIVVGIWYLITTFLALASGVWVLTCIISFLVIAVLSIFIGWIIDRKEPFKD